VCIFRVQFIIVKINHDFVFILYFVSATENYVIYIFFLLSMMFCTFIQFLALHFLFALLDILRFLFIGFLCCLVSSTFSPFFLLFFSYTWFTGTALNTEHPMKQFQNRTAWQFWEFSWRYFLSFYVL